MKFRALIAATALAALGLATFADATGVDLKNPGFESGQFRPWKKYTREGGGDWIVYRNGRDLGGPVPIRGGASFPPTPAGKRYAVATQDAPGLNILHRVLKVKRNKTNKLSFLFAYRTSADIVAPNNFEFESLMRPRGPKSPSNQQVRIDLMKPKAEIKSLRNRDILATVFRTQPGDKKQRKFHRLRINLTDLGIKHGKFRLRIAEVDDGGEFYVGIDDLKQTVKD